MRWLSVALGVLLLVAAADAFTGAAGDLLGGGALGAPAWRRELGGLLTALCGLALLSVRTAWRAAWMVAALMLVPVAAGLRSGEVLQIAVALAVMGSAVLIACEQRPRRRRHSDDV